MKRFLICIYLAVLLIFGSIGGAFAAHYIDGMEPTSDMVDLQKGFTVRMYNSFYTADTYKDNDGNSIGNVDVNKYLMTLRGYYMTNWELLGAKYGFSMGVPIGYNRLTIGFMPENDNFNFGDIYFEPIIFKWSGSRYDIVASGGVYIPTGDYKANDPTSVGYGYWGGLISVGGNYYFDDMQTIFATGTVRYEINSESRDTNWQPGDIFHTEYALIKRFELGETDRLNIGIGGYTKVQVSNDSGVSPLFNPNKAFVTAVGPSISYDVAPWGLSIGLKGYWEFFAKNQPEGMNFMLTIAQKF